MGEVEKLEDCEQGKISFKKKPALLHMIDKRERIARVIQRKNRICINVYEIELPCLCDNPQNYKTTSHHKNSSGDYNFLNRLLEVAI